MESGRVGRDTVGRTGQALALAAAAVTLVGACSTVSEARAHEGGPISVSSGTELFEDRGGDIPCGSTTAAVTAKPDQEADISNGTAEGKSYGFLWGALPMNPGDCADAPVVWIIQDNMPDSLD